MFEDGRGLNYVGISDSEWSRVRASSWWWGSPLVGSWLFCLLSAQLYSPASNCVSLPFGAGQVPCSGSGGFSELFPWKQLPAVAENTSSESSESVCVLVLCRSACLQDYEWNDKAEILGWDQITGQLHKSFFTFINIVRHWHLASAKYKFIL